MGVGSEEKAPCLCELWVPTVVFTLFSESEEQFLCLCGPSAKPFRVWAADSKLWMSHTLIAKLPPSASAFLDDVSLQKGF